MHANAVPALLAALVIAVMVGVLFVRHVNAGQKRKTRPAFGRSAFRSSPKSTTRPPSRQRLRSPLRWAFFGLSAVIASVGTATLALFVWPSGSQPAFVDAVVVLSGDHGERLPRGLELVRQGVAPTLVLNGTPDSPAVERHCHEPRPFEVVCLRPEVDNTREEAHIAGRLAAERQWRRLVVVTSTQHVTRARINFERCVDGSVHMVGARPPYGLRTSLGQIAREWIATLYALVFTRTC